MKPEIEDFQLRNGNGHVAPVGPMTPAHWAALKGRWSFEADVAVYEGPLDERQSFGLALSDLRLRDGRASVTIVFDNLGDASTDGSAGIVLGFHSETGSYMNPQLGGWKSATPSASSSPEKVGE